MRVDMAEFNSSCVELACNVTAGDNNGTTLDNEMNRVAQSLSWEELALVPLFCSIIAGTVAGNTLVIAAVITTRRLRTVTNCFVMSLALADFMVGVFVMPPKVALYLDRNQWKLGETLCSVWIALDILLCTASILSLCAISIDRYLAITRPLAYSRRRRSKRLAFSMIACVWAAAVIITSPPMLGWFDNVQNYENLVCDYGNSESYVVYSALGSFFLPLLVMLYVYARIACVIATRQNSIQRLANASEKKSQCRGGSDIEEPLQNAGHDHTVSLKISNDAFVDPNLSSERNSNNFQNDHIKSNSGFWRKFALKSCTSVDDESQSGSATKRSSSHGPKSRLSSDSETNSASGVAISLPDPATLTNVDVVSGQKPSNNGGNKPKSTATSPRAQSQAQSSRVRTGSRLCHHSMAATSPQRNIHRVHQKTSSASRLFPENELLALEESKGLTLSKSAPRVWTVEEPSPVSSTHLKSASRATSFKQERVNCRAPKISSSTLTVPPAGNPASIISSPTSNVASSSSQLLQGSNSRRGSRVCQLSHHQQAVNTDAKSSVSRGRSFKLTLNFHGSNHNHNGSSLARDFASGRVASFKRETKTAQTLAAVVGGFIICWLPFFVAYVMGPFIPSGVISINFMDALIWLGWSNSTINPFIYAFYSQDFRSAFWRLTVRKCGAVMRPRNAQRSPRRYDDHNHTHSRVSA